MSLVAEVLTGSVRGGTSILLAGLGETLAERAGVVFLGTEGSMLVGALAAYAVTAETGSPWIGLLAAALAGMALAAVHGVWVVYRRANQLACGLVVLFLALGLTSLFGADYVQREIHAFPVIHLPLLGDLPGIGPILFRHDAVTYLSFVLAPAVWWFLQHTTWGLRVRAAGERGDVLHVYGRDPRRTQLAAVALGGMLAGVGGGQLSTAYTKAWFENMVQGRGFIAVALVIFAAWHPLKVAGGAYLFGAALALSPALQARGVSINQFALDAVPYLLTLAALVVLARRRANATPEGLRAVFELTPSG